MDDQDRARNSGLTSREADERKAAGLANTVRETGKKTTWQIIVSNVFTLFNLVNVLIFILILMTGRYINTLFMGVVISNTLIGIIEEIKARRIIESLRIITAQSAVVIRDGDEKNVLPEELVMDDVTLLRPGSQICADSVVLDAEELEVDESLLTGESEPVRKKAGDQVLSGSFVVAGQAAARVVHVGHQNVAQGMTLEAHRYKRAHSEIITNVNKIIKVVAVLILPVGMLLFLSQYLRSTVRWEDAVVNSAAGIIGMIPEGLVLLTSITLTVGIIKMSRRRTIIQELAGLEVLARINVLCLDKTGTLTQGTLRVSEILPVGGEDPDMTMQAAAALAGAFPDKNSTGLALAAFFKETPGWQVRTKVPFSSSRMWSGASFENEGTWVMGAPEHLLSPEDAALRDQAAALAREGNRVILLASSETELDGTGLPDTISPRAFILLSDAIRPEAKAALEFFAENDVEIKIITGDNPLTAAAVARKLGLSGSDRVVDMSGVADDPDVIAAAAENNTIFGRVTPGRKRQIIRALQQSGKIVAMTGDGTNDVLAMHQADCSIVMASGSPAAKAMAHIALLDSDFTVLPEVVAEGRQVINNVERVAALYLTKTTYSMILSVFFILIGASYFFYPIHQTLLGVVSIGIPSFILAMEKNIRRIEPGFLGKVVRTAIPGGATIAVNLMALKILQTTLDIGMDQARLIAVIITGIAGLLVLLRVSLPLNRLRMVLLLAMTALFFTVVLFFTNLIELPDLQAGSLIYIAGFGIVDYPMILLFGFLVARLQKSGGRAGKAARMPRD